MVSSGAIMPARAPASMLMLHTVMRPAMSSPRIALPAYSMTWPVPPAVPILPMMASTTSFAVTPGASVALDAHQHVLRRLLQQGLRGEHVLDLGRADAERQRAHGTVGGGVAVAADDGRAGQADAQFRADDVDDALARVEQRDVGHAELGDVALQRLDLQAAFRLGDAGAAVAGRDVVVGDGDGRVRAAHPAAGEAKALERLRAGDLVDEVAVDVEDAGAVLQPVDDVGVPDLVEQRLGIVRLPRFQGLALDPTEDCRPLDTVDR